MVKISLTNLALNRLEIEVKGHTINFVCESISRILWLLTIMNDGMINYEKRSGYTYMVIKLDEFKKNKLIKFFEQLKEDSPRYIELIIKENENGEED